MTTIEEIIESNKDIRERYSKEKNNLDSKIYDIISKEPDYFDFVHKNLPCRILRHFGNLNGYVGVPKGHKLFEERYDTFDIDVHGGLTFGSFYEIQDSKYNDYFYFGFDTAHAGDLMLSISSATAFLRTSTTYKDFEYVKKQTIHLAEQLYNSDSIFMRKNIINKLYPNL
jgi:hypothetical protein